MDPKDVPHLNGEAGHAACPARPIPRVALLIESSRSYGRGILRGIAEYLKVYGPWSIFHEERSLGDVAPPRLIDWRPDGILARIENPQLVEQIRSLGVPTVDLFARYELEGVPSFDDDEQAIGRLAAEHLRQRGFRHFGFFGCPGVHYSDNRARYFAESLAAEGLEVQAYARHGPLADLSVQAEFQALADSDRIQQWLRGLPTPIGIFASNDKRAQHLLRVCGDAGVLVPEQVAVLGVDNDDAVCGLCYPPLSSIEPDTHRVGFEAAQTLAAMLRGETVGDDRRLIPPRGLVVRKSTHIIVTADRASAEALRLIREQACSGVSIREILAPLAVSRSTLERRFRELFGRSPKAELDRVRMERAKELLLDTDLTLAVIAQQTGFQHVETLHRHFRNRTGQSPSEFRRSRRPG